LSRIVRDARLVATGTDCGFASFAASQNVEPAIVWLK
jgi:hypothetical protein